MDIKVFIANFCAKLSCAKWNKIRVLRVIFRQFYWWLAEIRVRKLAKMVASGTMYCLPEDPWRFCSKMVYGAGLAPSFDLYAHTFYGADLYFARWTEEAGTLIGDRSKHVIRHSTSYCAFMIRLATGRWPTGQPRHAKEWLRYLADNGFTRIVDYPEQGEPYSYMWPNPKKNPPKAHFYIGVLPDVMDYGLVVWTDGTPTASQRRTQDGRPAVICSTYLNHHFRTLEIPKPYEFEKVTWVQIV